jgi:hypothetical protein
MAGGVTKPTDSAGNALPWYLSGDYGAPPQPTGQGAVGGAAFTGTGDTGWGMKDPTPATYDQRGNRVTPQQMTAEAIGTRGSNAAFSQQQQIFDRLMSATNGLGGNGGGGGGGASVGGTSLPPRTVLPARTDTMPNLGAAPAPISLSSYQPNTSKVADVNLAPASTAPSWQSIAGASQAQQDANESATFGKVKDNAANTAKAALSGLTQSLAARGMGGAGYEAGQVGGTLSREANTIGEGERQWAGTQYADAQHRADVNTQAGIAARGQDLSAAGTARGQDLGALQGNQGAAVSTRGQDIGAAGTARGQDLNAAEANQNSAGSSRGQDLNFALSGLSARTAQRGQDIGVGTTERGQDISGETAQRGQTLQANTAANALATQKQLALQQMLAGLAKGSPVY